MKKNNQLLLSSHKMRALVISSFFLGVFATSMNAASFGNGSANYSVTTASNPNYGSTSYTASTKTAAGIQDKIDSAASAGGGTVNLNSGTYWLKTEVNLKDKVGLIGKGSGSTYVKRGNHFSYETGTSGNTPKHMFGETDGAINDTLIRKMQIAGNWTTSSVTSIEPRLQGINMSSDWSDKNDKIRVRQCIIKRFGMGMTSSGTTNIRMEGCSIVTNGANNLWHNVYFRRIGRVYFSGNDISDSMEGNGFKFQGGTFSSDANESKHLIVRTSTHDDNWKNNLAIHGAHYGRIESSTFRGQKSTANRCGIYLNKADGIDSRFFDIINNTITGNADHGLWLYDVNGVNVEGNNISSNDDDYRTTSVVNVSYDGN